jgi:hypothetical protein
MPPLCGNMARRLLSEHRQICRSGDLAKRPNSEAQGVASASRYHSLVTGRYLIAEQATNRQV